MAQSWSWDSQIAVKKKQKKNREPSLWKGLSFIQDHRKVSINNILRAAFSMKWFFWNFSFKTVIMKRLWMFIFESYTLNIPKNACMHYSSALDNYCKLTLLSNNTPFPNLFAVTTYYMKTRQYSANCKQIDIRMWYLTHSVLRYSITWISLMYLSLGSVPFWQI